MQSYVGNWAHCRGCSLRSQESADWGHDEPHSSTLHIELWFITKRSQADKQTQSSVAEIQDICVRNIMEPGVYDLLFSLNLGCLSYMFGAKLCKLTQTTRKQKSNTIPQNIYLKSLIKIGSMISRTYMLHVSHTTKGQQKRTTIQLGQPLSQGHSCSWHPERMTCSCTQHPSLRKMGAYYGVHHESYYM